MEWACIENEAGFIYLPRIAITRAPEGKRKMVRLRETWRRERCEMGFITRAEAKRIAIERKRWKDTINSPILQVGVRK